MRSPSTIAVMTAVLLGWGCEHNPKGITMDSPEMVPLKLAAPDAAFRLTAAQRATVVSRFDVDALERLLARVNPELRREILAHFQHPSPDGRKRGALTELHDPELQAILEEVWVPMWDDAPDEALTEGWYYYPGRTIALQRREARKRADRTEQDARAPE